MSSSVSVLAPNGRRQTVKCTPNTTILQILEEVCRKQGFKPEDYDIKHHNKVLDTSISFRFSGLPNNAQLELATATKARVDSEVILAVNLEDGSRIVGNFLPDETLYNILTKMCPSELDPQAHPVVIYMRNEIYGERLHETSLRSLGLRGGRAMLRLVHKNPEELRTQANVSAPLPAKPVEEKPYHRSLKTEAVPLNNVVQKNEVDLLKLAKEREKRKLSSPTADAAPKIKPKVEEEEKMEVDVVQEPPMESLTEPQNVEESFVFLGERQAMLFSLESARVVPTEDLPDDFFELTIDDAKKILGDIRRKRQDMESAVLMTSAMRNLEESKKQLRHLHTYKQSVIRVQFSDQSILQGTFKPNETIKDVTDFVRNYLEDSSLDFHLYTTPPKCVLGENETLLELGCVPGALLHLGTHTEGNINLKTELKDKFTTNSVASLAASKLRERGKRSELSSNIMEDDSTETLTDVTAAGPSTQLTSYERKVVKTTEKVPKWFKPFK